MKSGLFTILLIMLLGSSYACYSTVIGDVELVSYRYPEFKEVSQFQHPEYSQFDIVYIKKFNITMESNCKNATITPRFYLETASGSEEEFLGLEVIKLENGSYVFKGTKQPGHERGKEDTISSGIQLTSSGEYSFVPFIELNYGDDRGSGTKVSGQSIYLKNGGLLSKYSFRVEDKSDKVIISLNNIWALLIGLCMITLIFAALSGEQFSPIKNWKEWAKYTAYFILALTISLAAIGLQMSIINKQQIEVNIFSFVETASGIFIAVLLAFIGAEFIESSKEKKGVEPGKKIQKKNVKKRKKMMTKIKKKTSNA